MDELHKITGFSCTPTKFCIFVCFHLIHCSSTSVSIQVINNSGKEGTTHRGVETPDKCQNIGKCKRRRKVWLAVKERRQNLSRRSSKMSLSPTSSPNCNLYSLLSSLHCSFHCEVWGRILQNK